jgi:formylglycine-generating enzyme required for sulfatase activity
MVYFSRMMACVTLLAAAPLLTAQQPPAPAPPPPQPAKPSSQLLPCDVDHPVQIKDLIAALTKRSGFSERIAGRPADQRQTEIVDRLRLCGIGLVTATDTQKLLTAGAGEALMSAIRDLDFDRRLWSAVSRGSDPAPIRYYLDNWSEANLTFFGNKARLRLEELEKDAADRANADRRHKDEYEKLKGENLQLQAELETLRHARLFLDALLSGEFEHAERELQAYRAKSPTDPKLAVLDKGLKDAKERESHTRANQAAASKRSKEWKEARFEFVEIPSGWFTMGSAKLEDDEWPSHTVEISRPFYINKYEVTQRMWLAYMGDNPSRYKDPDSPVDSVSWNDVQEFLGRLNRAEDGWHYRLPSEAEWEYAARAGDDGNQPEDVGKVAWYLDNAEKKTHPVGQKAPNKFGVYDMLGNVFEWCQDWYGVHYYANSGVKDPSGPAEGKDRVARGGGWLAPGKAIRYAYRGGGPPDKREAYVGFRVVREKAGAGQ